MFLKDAAPFRGVQEESGGRPAAHPASPPDRGPPGDACGARAAADYPPSSRGYPAANQADMLPGTLYTSAKPFRSRMLAARLDRYPLPQ